MSISKSQIESILNQTKQTKELVEKAPAKKKATPKKKEEPPKEEPLIEETATDEVDDEDWLS